MRGREAEVERRQSSCPVMREDPRTDILSQMHPCRSSGAICGVRVLVYIRYPYCIGGLLPILGPVRVGHAVRKGLGLPQAVFEML